MLQINELVFKLTKTEIYFSGNVQIVLISVVSDLLTI